MKIFKLVLLALVLVILITLSAVRSGNEGDASLRYSPANEVRIAGTVQEVQEFYCPVTDDRGTHLVMNTDDGPTQVHVAVSRHLRQRDVHFNQGDRVEVIGARIKYRGEESVIAREITRGNEVFILRDASGQMLWN